MQSTNKYGGVQAARFGNAGGQGINQAQQQQMMMEMQMDMEMGEDSYGDEYGDYDDEGMDPMVGSGDTDGGGYMQYGS